MAAISPDPLKKGVSYLNRAFNDLLAYVEQTKVIVQPGWTETAAGIVPPPFSGAQDAGSSALKVTIHSEGKLTQNAGTMPDTTVGSGWSGVPTLLSSDGVAYSANDVVVAKVEYEATDNTDEFSTWETTAITFQVYAVGSIPADTVPVWTTTWTSGIYYMTWAITNADSKVASSETGPCRIVYCGSADVRIIT
jgi:hypothetical protein